jgi:uncharacterized protein (DUF1778 family)
VNESSITIRVSDETKALLKAKAKLNKRSMAKEILYMIEESINAASDSQQGRDLAGFLARREAMIEAGR